MLPRLSTTDTSSVQHLSDADVDLQIPLEQNFKYYNVHDFHDNYHIKDSLSKRSLSILNCNIRSLSANFEILVNLLSKLNFSFSVVGLTEIKTKINKQLISNVNIPGYNFIQQLSKSNAGGIGFYINKHLKTKIRSDLPSCSDEYESLWIEIVSESEHNLLCGVIYKHPRGNIDNFMNYINMALERIHHEINTVLL